MGFRVTVGWIISQHAQGKRHRRHTMERSAVCHKADTQSAIHRQHIHTYEQFKVYSSAKLRVLRQDMTKRNIQ